jgi:hypothetical protein
MAESSDGADPATGGASARPPASVVHRSLPVQALAVVGAAWVTRVAVLGLSDSERVLLLASGGLLCFLSVWAACRSFGVRCAWAVLVMLVGLAFATALFLIVEVTGNASMTLLLLPPPVASGCCAWLGSPSATWLRRWTG